MHPEFEAICIKTPCPICEGSGKILTTGFGEPKKQIEKSCHSCKGRGVLLDLEATIEKLAGLGHPRETDEYYVIREYKTGALWRRPDCGVMRFDTRNQAQDALSTLVRSRLVSDNWNVMKATVTIIYT